MKALAATAITDAVLVSSSVSETDYPAWSAGATYALADRTISAHRVFESLIGGNIGHDPATSPDKWLDVGPTNRWAMFDVAAGPRTTAATTISVTLAPTAAISAVAMNDVTGASVRVRITDGTTTLYDNTLAGGGAKVFLNLPTPAGQRVLLTVAPDAGVAAIGKMLIGNVLDLGQTEASPSIGIIDYSRRDTDDFGVTTVVQRAWAKRLSLRTLVATTSVDSVHLGLVGLRARPAFYFDENQLSPLAVYGFLKEFDLALTVSTGSFFTLTIEGLQASTIVDSGIDPAVDGASDMVVVIPTAITPAMLTSSNVAETEYAAWAAGTTYALAARAIRNHRIVESLVAGNVGHDPASDSTRWLDVGPTNRWAMFDQVLGTATTAGTTITVQLTLATAITALALLDVSGSVRVQATGYDQTRAGPGVRTFFNLAAAAGAVVTVTISLSAGSSSVSVGSLIIGTLRGLGRAENAPKIGINDYSVKDTDNFGNTTVVQRGWAKRLSLRSLVASTAADVVLARIAGLRATPVLWVGSDGFDALAVFGFFRDFTLDYGQAASTCSFTIEGLTEADPPDNSLVTAITDAATTADYSNIQNLPAAIDPANMSGSGQISALQVVYSTGPGGATVASLQPAEAGSNVTATHTAAAIAGQAATATSSDYSVITGSTRPSDNAGTSGLLAPIGSYITIIGNSVAKLAGTHGGNEGGAVGTAQLNTAFITTSLLNVASGGSYQTQIALDDDATSFAFTSMNYWAKYQGTGAGAGTVQLFTTGNAQVGTNTNVTGLTANSRMRLIYDGNKVWVEIDGTVIGTKATAAAGQRLFPKVLPIFDANNLPAGQRFQTDILFGPYSDNTWASTSGSPNAPADNADVTATHTAASITGQTDWATYSGINTTGMAGRVTNLNSSGNLASLTNVVSRRINLLKRADDTTAIADADVVTVLGTAASITGQGSFATVSSAAYGSSLLTGFGTLAPLSNVTLGTNVRRADGVTAVTDATAITSLGTASAITSQADWATYTGINTTNMAGRVGSLDTSGNLAGINKITDRRLTLLNRADGTTAVTEAAVVTSLGTASAISGQGSFATQSSVAYGSSYLTGFGTLAPLSNVTLGTNVRRADGTTVVTDATAITSLGTAASISGQGALATLSAAAWGSNISGRPAELTDGRISTALTSAGLVQTRVPSTLLGNASASNIESDPYFVDTAAWSLWGSQTSFSTTAAAVAAIGSAKVIKVAIGSSNPLGMDGPLRDVPPNGTFFGAIKLYVEAGFIGQPQFSVKFFDRTGAQLDLTYMTFGTFASVAAAAAGTYDLVTPAKAAPAGTVKVAVALYSGNVAGAAAYFGLPVIGQTATPGRVSLGDTTNLIPDPDFIDPATTWARIPVGWSILANGTAGEGAGVNKVRLTSSMPGTMNTKLIPCPPLKSAITSIYLKAISGTGGDVIITPSFYNAAGGFISYGSAFTAYVTTGLATGRQQVVTQSPANTAYVSFGILNYSGAGNQVFEVSEPIIRFATVLGDNAIRADGTTVATEVAVVTGLGTAAAISGQGSFATQNSVAYGSSYLTGFGTLAPLSNVTLGTNVRQSNGTTIVTDATAITSLGTASAISGQGTLATLNSVNMDSTVADGSTYARPRSSELSSGYLRLGIAGSGAQVGDQRNLPPINATNLNSRFTGQTISYSAAAGSPATATISVSAFTTLLGSTSVSYNATSVGVTGTNGTTVNYLLYFDDATYAGGTRTLVATTSGDTLLSSNARVFVGACSVTFPSVGSGGGGGNPGGGGGCVDEESWITMLDSLVVASAVADDDQIECATPDMSDERTEFRPVKLMGPRRLQPCFRLHTKFGSVIASKSTPMTLRDLSLVYVPDMLGHDVLVKHYTAGAWYQCWSEVLDVEFVGFRWVVQIGVNDGMYFAGESEFALIATHNIYNKDF